MTGVSDALPAPDALTALIERLREKRDGVHPNNRATETPLGLKITYGDLCQILDALSATDNRAPVPAIGADEEGLLLPCPHCGGAAKRVTLGPDDGPDNEGGDVIVCTGKCGSSSHVEFGYKENLISLWNERVAARSDNRAPVEDGEARAIAEMLRAAERGEGVEQYPRNMLPFLLRDQVVPVLMCEAEPHVVADAIGIARQAAEALSAPTRAPVEDGWRAYPVEERAFHVVIRNIGQPDETFVAKDRATLSGYPARDRDDAHAMTRSLNAVVRHHVERALAAAPTPPTTGSPEEEA